MSIDENHIVLKINSIFEELDHEIEEFKNDFKNINNFSESKFYDRKNNIGKLMMDAKNIVWTYKSLKFQLNGE